MTADIFAVGTGGTDAARFLEWIAISFPKDSSHNASIGISCARCEIMPRRKKISGMKDRRTVLVSNEKIAKSNFRRYSHECSIECLTIGRWGR